MQQAATERRKKLHRNFIAALDLLDTLEREPDRWEEECLSYALSALACGLYLVAEVELDAAEAHALPELVEEKHIRGDLHMHTTESDGRASLAEMAEAAWARGLEYVAITDHSKALAMANGLDEKRAVAFAHQRDDADTEQQHASKHAPRAAPQIGRAHV